MKIIDSLWFSNATKEDACAGIIIIEEDGTGDRKAYIGVGSGNNEKADTDRIIAWGSKFSLDTIQRIRHFLHKDGGCDFECNKDEPLILLQNTNGDSWLCHLSCLKEQIEMHEEH